MFIDRRKALGILAAALGRIARGDSAKVDLSQIGAHVYSEEGIPMFLGCEDTTAARTRVVKSDFNRKVYSAFERYAQEWGRQHLQASAGDAAKVLEFLASRDLKSGGLEASL